MPKKVEVKMTHTQYITLPDIDQKFVDEAVANITEGMKERFGKEVTVEVRVIEEE